VLFYSPDHGEIIGLGHGLTFGGTDQYEIPMMMKYSHGDFCHEVEKYRNKDGYINSFAEHYIFSEFMGYSVTSQVIDNYMKESPFVYHSDDNVYHYPFLPQK
jgi:heptose-I-phosphate ethanolaminephosphotransferase